MVSSGGHARRPKGCHRACRGTNWIEYGSGVHFAPAPVLNEEAILHPEQTQLTIYQAIEIQVDERQYGIGHRLELLIDVMLVIDR